MVNRRMYIGTEAGIVVLAENDGRWDYERNTLEGKHVDALVASDEVGVVYAGVGHDGVYASTDGGRSWDHVFRGDVRSLAVDPSSPASLYAGTEPVHLYRSRDSGDSWAEIEGLQHMPESVREKWWFPVYPHDPHVLSVFVDPRDGRRVYVGLEHGGILRTDDGGENWEDISAGIEYLDIHMVVGDPARENLVYAATARGFYRSEDNGLSWHQLGGGLPGTMERMIWNVVGDPSDDARLYAGAGDYAANLPKGVSPGGEIWATADRGATWNRVYEASSPVRKVCVTLV